MGETCALCGGPIVMLPARGGVDGNAGYTPGLTCLGCAPLDAVPRGMVPENRPGADAASRRFTDAIDARMEAAQASTARASNGMFVGPPRFWVGLWRRFWMRIRGLVHG